MTQRTQQDLFRTSDIAQVTYFRQNGHATQDIFWDDDTESVYWLFVPVASLLELVEKFSSGEARVEPREYDRLFGIAKKEMYTLADPHRR